MSPFFPVLKKHGLSTISKGSVSNHACHSNPTQHFWTGCRVQKEAIRRAMGCQAAATGSPQPVAQISSSAAPGARLSLKVSLVITIAVGGLARPVSPKNQGVDSQADERQKAQLVPPLRFAVQGLCHSRAARLGGHCRRQPSEATPRGFWVA